MLAGSAIPLSDVHAVDNLFEYDTINIDQGALVESARTANLLTPSYGPNGDPMVAQAKAESWVSDLSQALLGSGALLDVSFARSQFMDQIVDNYVHFGANGEQFDLATDASGTRGYYADNFGIQMNPGDRKRTGISELPTG